MRISDWSSDVCSSDLHDLGVRHAYHLGHDEHAGSHARRHEHASGRGRWLDRARHMTLVPRHDHHRDGECFGSHRVGSRAAGAHLNNAATHAARLVWATPYARGKRDSKAHQTTLSKTTEKKKS